MLIHSKIMLSFYIFIFILLNNMNTLTSELTTTTYQPKDHYLINFGLSKLSTQPSGDNVGTWRSDEEFRRTPPSATANTTVTSPETTTVVPYNFARIFWEPTTYTIPLTSWGPKLVRLYLYPPFSPTSQYNTIDTTKSLLTLTINGFEILKNFSAYLVAAHAQANPNTNPPVNNGGLVREIYVTVNKGDGPKALNMTFSPTSPLGFGFINGVEVISVPDTLYVNFSSVTPYLEGNYQDYISNTFSFSSYLAMENIIRLNVGGASVVAHDDTGIRRTWYDDDNFFHGILFGTAYNTSPVNISYTKSTPFYTAPVLVYSTMRYMGSYDTESKMDKNLTWGLEVDSGFNYLVRLHFCDLLKAVNEPLYIMFDIYINNQQASQTVDAVGLGGVDIPTYRDFVTHVYNTSSNGSREILWVTLIPELQTKYDNAYLNGLEIFKLNLSSGSLAALNPTLPQSLIPVNTPTPTKKSSKHKLPIIIGVIVGVILVSLLFVCFIIIYRRKKAKQAMTKEDSNKMKWISPLHDSSSNGTMTSVGSSLPSDLCRRFSFTQIKVATCDFDDNSIIGTGGFGKVYKGSLDNGDTQVAVKRLNSTSKQGAREFQTEIEMLSKLRHVNLVSLIGYCDDYGEMILVYEYMPRGTLRDHLLYKNLNKNNVTPLSWKQRLMICVGSARGLHYLHSGAKQLIIHRDVKSTNILLDEKWTAKVSDFGLSKIGAVGGEGGATHVSTAVKGSVGYLDPEYYRSQQLTEKSDVYSFGVLLFEVLCARPVVNPILPREEANLAAWARKCYNRGTLHTIMDPNLTGQIATECLKKYGDIAEQCVRDRGSERPSMGDIVWGLEFALKLQETAEENNVIEGGIRREFLDPNIGNHGANANNDSIVSTISRDDSSTKKLLDSGTSVSSSSDFPGVVQMKSFSVFSEMVDPQGR